MGDISSTLLTSLRSRGFTLWLEYKGDEIVPQIAPAKELKEEDRVALRESRGVLIEELKREHHQWLELKGRVCVVFGISEQDLKENVSLAKRDPWR